MRTRRVSRYLVEDTRNVDDQDVRGCDNGHLAIHCPCRFCIGDRGGPWGPIPARECRTSGDTAISELGVAVQETVAACQ
jgi:hypothetical protein